MDTSLSVQSSTFFEQIKSCEGLDLRDNRGKRHCIGFVLLSLSISLLRNRDGNLSSLHRSMVNKQVELCQCLNHGFSTSSFWGTTTLNFTKAEW